MLRPRKPGPPKPVMRENASLQSTTSACSFSAMIALGDALNSELERASVSEPGTHIARGRHPRVQSPDSRYPPNGELGSN